MPHACTAGHSSRCMHGLPMLCVSYFQAMIIGSCSCLNNSGWTPNSCNSAGLLCPPRCCIYAGRQLCAAAVAAPRGAAGPAGAYPAGLSGSIPCSRGPETPGRGGQEAAVGCCTPSADSTVEVGPVAGSARRVQCMHACQADKHVRVVGFRGTLHV